MVFRICGVISSISVAVLKQSYIFTFSIFNPAVCRLYNLILCFICLVHICPISSNTYILCSFCPLLRGTFLHFHQLEQLCSSNSAGVNFSCLQNLIPKLVEFYISTFCQLNFGLKVLIHSLQWFPTTNLIR